MRIIVTGSEGYLGALFAPLAIKRGYEVVGIDSGFFRRGQLYNNCATSPKVLSKDIRDIDAGDLEGFDAVVHMAELSNDPLGELNEEITFDINHKGSVRLANKAKEAGVSRFVYMSSCSVYGVASESEVDETSAVNPQTAYAKCKFLCERDMVALASKNFSPCYFRNATAFGASPRQRFDLVLNNLCGAAWTEKEIRMTSDGSPWRPIVHGLDIAQAIFAALEAPKESIHNEVFNIGANDQNYQIREIAETVGDVFAGCEVSFGSSEGDNRSYRVKFDKIQRHLPSFQCKWSAKDGVVQFRKLFESIGFTAEEFAFEPFTRLKELQRLLATGQVDNDLYWQTLDPNRKEK